jgi:Zn-dependent protease
MNSGLSLGSIWKVPIKLHISWFLIAGLITWSLATGYFPTTYPGLSAGVYWLLGLITAVFFAASVLLHELGHVAMALREHIPVRGVTLFIFGGISQITSEPKSAGAEFRIAIAGPLVSLALGGLFGLLWLVDRTSPMLAAPSEYLFRINLLLGLFNLIPGFPLDGGRVLRAALWKFTGSLPKATKVASIAGQLVAFGFITYGVLSALTGSLFDGLWMAFIGWFLQNAAAAVYQVNELEQSLGGVTVDKVMKHDFCQVGLLTPLTEIINSHVLNSGQRYFLVMDGSEVQGLVTLQNIAAIPQRLWPFTTARQAMTPIARVEGLAPYTELLDALRTLETEDQQSMPVIQDHQLVGILSRDDISHYLKLRRELGMRP